MSHNRDIRTSYRVIGAKQRPWVSAGSKIVTLGGTMYLIYDQFASTLAKGSVDGTNAEPGPGIRWVTDEAVAATIEIAGGRLLVDGTGNWNEAEFFFTESFARVAGRPLLYDLNYVETISTLMHGWNNDPEIANGFGGFNKHGFLTNAAYLAARFTAAANSPEVFALSTGQINQYAIVLRSPAGRFMFIKPFGGANWLLYWHDEASSVEPLYLGTAVNGATPNPTYDNFRVPVDVWLPVPTISDGFGGTVEDADGLGHAETSGLGAGGSGSQVWTGGEFGAAVSGITITPSTTGSELVTNGDFSAWTGDDPDNWTVGGEVGSDPMVTETVNGARFYASATANQPQITQWLGAGVSTSNWYLGTVVVSVSNNTPFDFRDGAGGWKSPSYSTTGTKTHAKRLTNAFVSIVPGSSANDFTLGSISVLQLDISTCFSNTFTAPADLTVQVDLANTPAGYAAGLVARLDSTSSPANYILAYHDGTNAVLEKYVAGSVTSLISSAAAFVADATLKVILTGTQVQLWYNGSQIGATQTVSDAGILSNTIHGAFATDSSITLDNLQGIGTWTNGSGVTKNTPVYDTDLVTNGDFANWTADDPDNWTITGESLPNREISEVGAAEGHGGTGTGACNWWSDLAAGLYIQQNIGLTMAKFYAFSWTVTTETGVTSLIARPTSGAGIRAAYTGTGAKTASGLAVLTSNINMEIQGVGDITADDYVVQEIPAGSVFKLANAGTPDVVLFGTVSAWVYGSLAGLVFRVDDPDDPQSYLMAAFSETPTYFGRKMYIYQNNAGTITVLAGKSFNADSGDKIFVAASGTDIKVYVYDNSTGLWDTGTIVTTTVTTGNYVGLVSTDAGNTFDNFTIYPRGTSGEWAALDNY